MPDKKTNPDVDVSDLEKKVDSMMAPNGLKASKNTPDAPKVPPSQKSKTPNATDTLPQGVPEVPKDIAKDLDAFSTDAPDIASETDVPTEPNADADQTDMQSMVSKAEPSKIDPIDDPATDAAVTDIVQDEADTVLAVADDQVPKDAPVKKQGIAAKISIFFRAWWRNKKARYITIFVLIAVVVGLAVWPTSRYAAMNTVGIRSSASIKITDDTTGLPLKNVQVAIGNTQVKTDEKGIAAFRTIKLGTQSLVVQRVAFADIKKDITIGWGSNPLGQVGLRATGVRYEIAVKDFVSGAPLRAEAGSGEASAFADKDGVVALVLDSVDKDTVDVTVKTDGYRTEKLTFAANKTEPTSVRMVPSHPVVFVSKQSGTYDVYKMDVDGKNKKLLLAGTGRERQDIALSVSPSGTEAVVVSSRGTNRDSQGYLLDTLTRIDFATGSTKTIDEANSIRLVDWTKQRLVYVATYAAASAAIGDRQRIVAYNMEESARSVLAATDYFTAVASVDGYVHYAIAESDPKQPASFQKIRIDGTGKQQILTKQIWSANRTGYNTFSLETPDGWYGYTVGDTSAAKGTAPAESYNSRHYVVSYDGRKSVWLDNRDGKGTLLVRDQTSGKETVLVAAGGLTLPVRWLNETTLLYRVVTASETAEYVKSTSGGESQKITNVTNTGGLSISF